MACENDERVTLRVLSGSDDPVICRCLRVSRSTIVKAISEQNLTTVDQITDKTDAGGACMCCHRVLQKMLSEHHGERDVRIPAQLCAGPVD